MQNNKEIFGYKGVVTIPEIQKQEKTEKARDPRRLLQYLDGFFGVRNGIKGNPIEGTNFTIETLTYMTSHNRADQITNMIVDRMNKMGRQTFEIFECCASIGGNTLSFLENPAVMWVVSYELLPERREMLKKNISMYNLATRGGKPIAFIPDEPFNGVPDKFKGVVLYMDPPWLPSHIRGHESTKDQYVLHDIKVGDKTLRDWIISCKNTCSMVVMRVPPGYRMDPIPGINLESKLVKNSLVIFATPKVQAVKVVKKIEPVKPVKVIELKTTDKWREGLKRYIRDDLLKMIFPNPKHREQMVSDKAMEVWVVSFTHESYNPNQGKNYEKLELLGDHSMEFSFIKYLYKNYAGITHSEMSDTKSAYMSKPFQGKIARQWGMDKWVRMRGERNISLSEDLLEAFYGALDVVGDMVFKFNAGVGLGYNMIIKIFEDIKIVRGKGKLKEPKTKIKEMFEGLHWGEAVETFQKAANGSVTATISLTNDAINSLRQLGVNVNSPVLSIEYGRDKKLAFKNAYRVALDVIRKIGITDEWVKKFKYDRDLNTPELVPYIQAVQNRLKSEKYVKFHFKKTQTTQRGKYIQLIGTKPDGEMVVLEMVDEPVESELEGKRQVLEKYARGQ